jgi:hypothetical protein
MTINIYIAFGGKSMKKRYYIYVTLLLVVLVALVALPDPTAPRVIKWDEPLFLLHHLSGDINVEYLKLTKEKISKDSYYYIQTDLACTNTSTKNQHRVYFHVTLFDDNKKKIGGVGRLTEAKAGRKFTMGPSTTISGEPKYYTADLVIR